MHIVTNREGRTTGSSFGAAGFETTTTYNKTEITLPICGSCSDLLAKMRNGEIAAVVGSLFLTFPVFAFLVWEVGTLIFGAAEPKNEDAKLVVTCLIGMCAASTTGAMYADFKSRRFPDYINKSISCYPQIAELLRQGWDWGGCPGSEKPQGI